MDPATATGGCDAFTAALASSDASALPAALREHAARCAACAELLRLDAALRTAGAAPHAALAPSPALRAALERDHAPVRGYAAWRRAAAPFAAAAALCSLVAALMRRGNIGAQVPWLFWSTLALGVVAVIAGLWLVLDRGPTGLERPARARWLYLLLAGAAFELLAWHPAHALEPRLRGETRVDALLSCGWNGLLAALFIGAVVFRAARRTAPGSPGAAGAAAGAAAGFSAAVALHLHCPSSHPLHVGLSHAAPVAIGAMLGWLAGRRVMAP